MSLPDRRIDPKILKSAEEEFMEKGFADASLRGNMQKSRRNNRSHVISDTLAKKLCLKQ